MAVSFRMCRWMLLVSALFLPSARCSTLHPPPREDEDYSDPLEDEEEEEEASPPSAANCSRCSENRERRAMRLQSIKSQILSQLGLREAPNVTDRGLPRVPPLDHLLDRYAMQADAPHFVPGPEYGEEDDYYLSAEKVLAFAQRPREYQPQLPF